MPSKEPCTCPVCQHPGIVNLSQHLNGVHSICGQERKQLIRGGLIGTEVMTGVLFNIISPALKVWKKSSEGYK